MNLRVAKWMTRFSFAFVDPRVRVAVLAALALTGHAPRLHAAAAKTPPPAAAVSTDTVRLSLSDAVSRALERGQELRIADAQILSARGQIKQAIAPALPQVNGTVTYERQFASIFQAAGPDTGALADLFRNSPFGSQHSWTAELTASQLLWSSGRVGAGLSAARAANRSVRANRAEVANQLAFDVESAYLNAAVAQQEVDIRRAGLEQARAHLEQVRLANREGGRSDYDLIRAQVDAANEEPQLVAATNAARIALLDLKRRIVLPLDQPIALTTSPGLEDGMVPVLEEDATLAGNDISHRPAVARAEADVEGRRQLVRLQRAARLPQLTLNGTLQQQAFPSDGWPGIDDFHRNLNANVKLTVPIFQGLATEGAVQRATADFRQAEAVRDQTRDQASLDVARARRDVRRTLAELVARRGTADLAARGYHLADVRFKNGMATQLEVTDARVQEQTARINEVDAIRDYRLALLDLERVLGRSVPTVARPLESLSLDAVLQEP